jgi:hypothetical protein
MRGSIQNHAATKHYFFAFGFALAGFFLGAAFFPLAAALGFAVPKALSQFFQNSGVVPVRTIGPLIASFPHKRQHFATKLDARILGTMPGSVKSEGANRVERQPDRGRFEQTSTEN